MKRALVILFVMPLYFASYSQESSIKLYSNFTYFNAQVIPKHFDYHREAFDFSRLSIAYRKINQQGTINQVEAGFYFRNQHQDNEDIDQLEINLRYERGKYLRKRLFKTGRIQLGGALRAYYLKEKLDVPSYNQYSIKNQNAGLNLSFFAHAEFDLSKRSYFEINTSIIGIYYGLDFRHIDHPDLTERQRQNTYSYFDILGERVLRIGLGYRLRAKSEDSEESNLKG